MKAYETSPRLKNVMSDTRSARAMSMAMTPARPRLPFCVE